MQLYFNTKQTKAVYLPEAIKDTVILALFTLAESTDLLFHSDGFCHCSVFWRVFVNKYSVFRLITSSGVNKKGDFCKTDISTVNVYLLY